MTNPQSFVGPCIAKADVNGDGLEDVYVGGGNGQPGTLYMQEKNGMFIKKPEPVFEAEKQSTDADAVFFDANKDGRPDLYVVSGGYVNFAADDPLLQDRLYINMAKATIQKRLMHCPKCM
jgi:hypothetical protein